MVWFVSLLASWLQFCRSLLEQPEHLSLYHLAYLACISVRDTPSLYRDGLFVMSNKIS